MLLLKGNLDVMKLQWPTCGVFLFITGPKLFHLQPVAEDAKQAQISGWVSLQPQAQQANVQKPEDVDFQVKLFIFSFAFQVFFS